jgi:hypothetical protein
MMGSCFLLLLLAAAAPVAPEAPSDQEARTIVERLEQRLHGISPPRSSTSERDLAGHYTAETARLAKTLGGGFLAGSDLYLFSDHRYLYVKWADVEPEAISLLSKNAGGLGLSWG